MTGLTFAEYLAADEQRQDWLREARFLRAQSRKLGRMQQEALAQALQLESQLAAEFRALADQLEANAQTPTNDEAPLGGEAVQQRRQA